MTDDALAQPDFQAMSRSFVTLSTEIGRCANLAQVQEVATLEAIMGQLAKISDNIKDLKDDVRVIKGDVRVLKDDVRVLKDDVRVLKDKMGNMEDKVNNLTLRMSASESNVSARFANSVVSSDNQVLAKLHSSAGGEIINCPGTRAELNAMTRPELQALLVTLGQPSNGNVAELKQRVKVTMGIKTELNF